MLFRYQREALTVVKNCRYIVSIVYTNCEKINYCVPKKYELIFCLLTRDQFDAKNSKTNQFLSFITGSRVKKERATKKFDRIAVAKDLIDLNRKLIC